MPGDPHVEPGLGQGDSGGLADPRVARGHYCPGLASRAGRPSGPASRAGRCFRHQLVQEIESLCCRSERAEKAYARDVAARSAQAGHEADFDWVETDRKG